MRRLLGLARSMLIYWRPGRQRGLRTLYSSFVNAGDLVFDVGAHLGDRTVTFCDLGARVIAIEPQEDVLPWLRRRIGRKSGATLVNAAVGREKGTGSLLVSDNNPTLSTLADDWRKKVVRKNPSFREVRWNRRQEVRVTTLDALIEEHGEPSFCKIDVEGHEAEVLSGLSQSIAMVSIEFVSGTLEIAEASIDRLESLGHYEYNAIPGEKRRFLWEAWQTPDKIRGWLAHQAIKFPSGDLYARRISRLQDTTT